MTGTPAGALRSSRMATNSTSGPAGEDAEAKKADEERSAQEAAAAVEAAKKVEEDRLAQEAAAANAKIAEAALQYDNAEQGQGSVSAALKAMMTSVRDRTSAVST